ncbi:MAG: hypothetical protein ACRD3C_17920 [Vicinamibacterales bacterium]
MRTLLMMLGIVTALLLVGRVGTATVSRADVELSVTHSAVDPRLDMQGNMISNAVEDYRVDLWGNLYESHAPDTALLDPTEPET